MAIGARSPQVRAPSLTRMFLSTTQDRLETAQRLWDRYLDAKADRLVTMPDDIVIDLKKKIVTNKSSDPELFDQVSRVCLRSLLANCHPDLHPWPRAPEPMQARKDVLNLMTDNIYPAFMKVKREESAKVLAVVPPSEPPGAGSCCITS